MFQAINMFVAGDVSTGTKKGQAIVLKAGTITTVYGVFGTAGTGGSAVLDINKNGTTIFSGATKLTIPISTTTAVAGSALSTTNGIYTVAAGDIITFDVDTADSGNAAADMTVGVLIEYAQ